MKKTLIYLFVVFIFLYSVAGAATYYIDSVSGSDTNNGTSTVTAFAHSPGMSGCSGTCSSTTLSANDVVVFKGGSTWTLSGEDTEILTVSASGITYIGGQRCGQSGSVACNGGVAWGTGYPIFDGNGVDTAKGVYSSGKSNIVIDGLKVVDVGYSADGSGTGIIFFSGSGIETKYCYLDTNAVTAWHYGVSETGSSTSAIYFHHNTVINSGRVTIQVDNNTVDDVKVYNNLMAGVGTWDPHSYHGDGFMIGGDRTTTAYAITNLLIYNNKFYGQWTSGATAAIYLNGSSGTYSINGAKIFNNIVSYENNTCTTVPFSPGAISVYTPGYHKNIEIYNNTVAMDACTESTVSHCIYIAATGGTENLSIKNNIISGCDNGITFDNVSGTIYIDSNLFYTRNANHIIYDISESSRYDACSTAQAAGWGTTYCSEADPKYIAIPAGSVTGSGNWALQSDSPAINNGQTIAGFSTDYDGNSRTGAWDIGAYEDGSSSGNAAVGAGPGVSLGSGAGLSLQ